MSPLGPHAQGIASLGTHAIPHAISPISQTIIRPVSQTTTQTLQHPMGHHKSIGTQPHAITGMLDIPTAVTEDSKHSPGLEGSLSAAETATTALLLHLDSHT
eukprot:866428-Amorphochlora_amoeboformis.AAC.1